MKLIKFILALFTINALFSFSIIYSDTRQQKIEVKDIMLTDADAAWANNQWKGITMQDLKSGQEIFNNRCHKCHGLKNPHKFSAEKLQKVVPKMANKAKLDKQQEDLILKFMMTVGRSNA